jgi:chromate transport protein ChrA
MTEELIRLLSQKLDVSTEFVYQALRQQVYVARITDAVGMAFLLIIIYACIHVGKTTWQKRSYTSDIPYEMFAFLCAVVAFTCVLVITICLESVVSAWVNPDGWILLRLLSELK